MHVIIKLILKILKGEWHYPRRRIQTSKSWNASSKPALNEPSIRQKIEYLPKARVLRVIDGDTIIIKKGWRVIIVRLDSIDCPEDGQYWGDIAKYGLIKLIGGQKVRLEAHEIDIHGRTVATIYVWHRHKNEWINVCERMVTLGHAWVMRRFYNHLPQDRRNKLNHLESWAKAKKVGLWHESNPIPPWKWRNKE